MKWQRLMTRWPRLSLRDAAALRAWVVCLLLGCPMAAGRAEGPGAAPSAAPAVGSPSASSADSEPLGSTPEASPLSAHELVREGNRLLTAGDIVGALEHYRRAEALVPEAPQIAFDQGLSYYKKGDYEKAREAFRRATQASDPALSEDARFALAATDHTEALTVEQDVKAALTRLENAMRGYQDVLATRPDYQAVREAHHRAARSWRMIKDMLEQQTQQQQSSDQDQQDGDPQDRDESQDRNPSQDQSQAQDEQQKQEQNQDRQSQQESPSEQQQSDPQQQPESSEEQAQPEPQPSQSDSEAPEQQAAEPAADQTSDDQQKASAVPQEPEERQADARERSLQELRRLLDLQRKRKQDRRDPPSPPPAVAPVDKDW